MTISVWFLCHTNYSPSLSVFLARIRK